MANSSSPTLWERLKSLVSTFDSLYMPIRRMITGTKQVKNAVKSFSTAVGKLSKRNTAIALAALGLIATVPALSACSSKTSGYQMADLTNQFINLFYPEDVDAAEYDESDDSIVIDAAKLISGINVHGREEPIVEPEAPWDVWGTLNELSTGVNELHYEGTDSRRVSLDARHPLLVTFHFEPRSNNRFLTPRTTVTFKTDGYSSGYLSAENDVDDMITSTRSSLGYADEMEIRCIDGFWSIDIQPVNIMKRLTKGSQHSGSEYVVMDPTSDDIPETLTLVHESDERIEVSVYTEELVDTIASSSTPGTDTIVWGDYPCIFKVTTQGDWSINW